MRALRSRRRLRAEGRTRHVPAIVVSADGSEVQDERSCAAVANDHLTKPLDVRHLLDVSAAHPPARTAMRG